VRFRCLHLLWGRSCLPHSSTVWGPVVNEDQIAEFIEELKESGERFDINDSEPYMGDGIYPDLTPCIPINAVEDALLARFGAPNQQNGDQS
jgi:hypothetical protein